MSTTSPALDEKKKRSRQDDDVLRPEPGAQTQGEAAVEKKKEERKSDDLENQISSPSSHSHFPAPSSASATAAPPKESAFKALGWLDRLLALWILLAMIVGIVLGNFVPGTAAALERGQFVGVSVPIAVGLLVMMYPILCKVKYETLHQVFSHRGIWKQIGFSVFMNWIIAPLLMLALGWACLPDKPELRTGLILVGLGRCIAMVLIWTGLAGGDNEYCAILVAINSILQMVLFAPLAVLFIRVISRESGLLDVSYDIVATSVGVFLGIPLGAAMVSRFALRALAGPDWYRRVFLRLVEPWSLIGLLYTILILFAYQGQQVVHQIVSVVRVAVPLVVYFVVIFFATLWVTHRLGFGYALGATQSFTAASNNFELAIAVAIATYGPHSDQALASAVGPLIEVPVLLALVYLVRWMGNRWAWKN
ncbi:arsenical-resistance protein ACR3 [Xylariomycetidae sp. FL2044]|nr:arsenical-resistance protein ACR3 [Xylariomycetidae sp. FL2044]